MKQRRADTSRLTMRWHFYESFRGSRSSVCARSYAACVRLRCPDASVYVSVCARVCVEEDAAYLLPRSIYFLIAAKLSWSPWQVPSLSRWKREREARTGEEGPYITGREKRPSTGRLISEAFPPAPFKAPVNPRPGHESRHSVASPRFHPFPPPCPLQTYSCRARR